MYIYNYIYRCIIVTSWFKPIPSPIFIPSGVIKLGARQSIQSMMFPATKHADIPASHV